MPTAVYDASYLTFRKRAKTLSAYYTAQQAQINANNLVVRSEQPTFQSGEVITTRKQGGCFCTNDAAGLSATEQGPGACGCAR